MGSLDKIIRLANRFSRKLSLAQGHSQTAQPSEIDKVLYDAKLRPDANELSPFLDKANVPATAHLSIGIVVDPSARVVFYTNPKFAQLETLLNGAYAGKMQSALRAAKVAPAETMHIEFAKF